MATVIASRIAVVGVGNIVVVRTALRQAKGRLTHDGAH